MNRTHHGNSAEGGNVAGKQAQPFNEERFFRHLETVATDVRQCLKQDQQRPDYKVRLVTAIKEMMIVIRDGKIRARNLPKLAYQAFLGRISAIVKKTGVVFPDDIMGHSDSNEPLAPDETPAKTATSQVSNSNSPGGNEASAKKWQVVSLAIKITQAGSVTIGVFKHGVCYSVFRRRTNGQHDVVPAVDLAAAKANFYNLIKHSGYTEISPGSYAVIRAGSV